MFDVFLISKDTDRLWELRNKFPLVKLVKDIDQACLLSLTKMFWVIWDDIIINDNFKFDYTVPLWDQKYIHVFKNGEFYDGVCLFPKNKQISKREFEYRFFTEKKEIDIVASNPKPYDRFVIDTYEDYETALEKSTTDSFWMIPKEVEIIDDSILNSQFERNVHHGFKHKFREETNYNGINLICKNKKLNKKEIDYRFIVEKKEHEFVATKLKPLDIVFISYNEPNADENYQRLLDKFPRAKRVDKVKGIHNAHIKAAEISDTENFWVVDGDAVILDDFYFDYEVPVWDRDVVYIWHSLNPVNGLDYGYGGVKLLPRKLTLAMDTSTIDMTTSISKKIKVIEKASNYTAFNTDPFNTWKSAFRESVKLLTSTTRNADKKSLERYDIWATQGADKPYGEYSIKGAVDAKEFVEGGGELSKINDFEFLYERFNNKS
jgi:hypothetical protein